ncbi:MAG: PepSY-like domain-containing protein [Bacteroidales bacterium]
MKRMILTVVAGLLLFTTGCAQERVLNKVSELPQTAQTLISTYFSQDKISYIKVENEVLESKKYEIKFTSGTEIDFDKNGNWTEINCKKNAIPNNLIPAGISSYVKGKYSQNIITKIEKEAKGYSVELNNDLDLVFDKKGNFLKIEH